MSIPTNKTELLTAIQTSYSKLKIDLEDIPVDLTKEKTLIGHAKGTMMSVCNLLSYLIGWGTLVLKWQEKKAENEAVDFPETGYKWNELGRLAQQFYKDYEALDYPQLQEQLQEVVATIQQSIENTSNDDLYHKAWYDKWTQGKMIQLNTASPYKNARTRIRKWKRENKERIENYKTIN